MFTPLDTLFMLTDKIRNLDMVQEWIDEARIDSSTNQYMQLTLDRQQVEVDAKREMIAETMFQIANRN